MKVQNMKSSKGRDVPNQFIMTSHGIDAFNNPMKREIFQSYNSVIAERITWINSIDVVLDEKYWDYSTTTGKYRNQFLGETKEVTERKIKTGEYKLMNLN